MKLYFGDGQSMGLPDEPLDVRVTGSGKHSALAQDMGPEQRMTPTEIALAIAEKRCVRVKRGDHWRVVHLVTE